MLNMAQQNVIDGKHVVRVPISTNSAIYFTNVDGVMQTYIYKWLNEKPGNKFTGKIVSYSFRIKFKSKPSRAGLLTLTAHRR